MEEERKELTLQEEGSGKKPVNKKALTIAAVVLAVLIAAGLVLFFVLRPAAPEAPQEEAGEEQEVIPETEEYDPGEILSTEPLPESAFVKSATLGDYDYDLYEDYAVITKYRLNASEVTIPETLEDKPVMAIGKNAFSSKSLLSSVTLPSSTREIGEFAFGNCTSLTAVTLPASVHALGDYAFSGCTSLSEVSMTTGVKSIGLHAFDAAPYLESGEGDFLIVGDGILIAYRGVGGSIAVPTGVRKIVSFSFCETLTDLYIPQGVTEIGSFAFAGCTNLASLILPDTVTAIGESAFSACDMLTELRLNEGLTSVGDSLFQFCGNLHKVSFPASLDAIGDNLFDGVETLEAIYVTPGTFAEQFFAATEYAPLIISEEA